MDRSRWIFLLASLSLLGLVLVTSSCDDSVPPIPGLPERHAPGVVAVPGGLVSAPGRNLLVPRVDLSLDTHLGAYELGAVYDLASARWWWSFEPAYDGATFRDAGGAVHQLGGVADGAPIPGTRWVRIDATSLRTRGGLVHEFGPSGELQALRWASAEHPRVELVREGPAGAERVTSIRQCTAPGVCGALFALTWDAAGRLVAVDDRAGRRAEYAWDAAGRLAAARDGLDVERGWPGFRYGYADGALRSIETSEGERVEIAETADELVVTAVGEESPAHRFRFGAAPGGLLATEHEDPLGHVTVYRYDGQRRVREIELLATGELTRLDWQGPRVVRRTDAAGNVTEWTWQDDEPASEIRPGGNVVRTTWAAGAVNRGDPAGAPLLRAEDDLGPLEERSYDAQGRLLSLANGAGEAVLYAWAADETLASVTAPDGRLTELRDYGDHGHPETVEVDGAVRTRRYDAVGNLLARDRDEGEPGGVAGRAWDADRNLAELVLYDQTGIYAAPHVLRIERRSDGRPVRILRPGGAHAEFDYDALGRLVERRDRAGGAWRATRFEWDAAGRLRARERPNGMREETDFDPAGRPAARRLGTAPAAWTHQARFTWQQGRLVEVDDDAWPAPQTRSYDGAGRLVSVIHPEGERTDVEYDLRSRPVRYSLLAPDVGFARTLELGYDAAGREVSVRDAGLEVVARTWADGRLAETRTGNGLARTYDYGESGLLLAETRDPGGALVERTTDETCTPVLGLGACVARRTETFGSLPAVSQETFSLAPEPQVTPDAGGWRLLWWEDGFGEGHGWSYDARSNVLHTGDSSFVYGAEGERLERIDAHGGGTVHTYAYDEAGFVVARDGVPIAWDAAGRVVSVGTDVAFTWDTGGRLVEATVAGATTRRRFGGLVESAVDGTPLALDLGEVRADLVSGAHLYRHFDARGNVKVVTDDAGQPVAHRTYRGYGPDGGWGAVLDGPGFARGRELGGLVLLGHRLLDPDAARFLAPDPVYQLVNAYAYTLGNPVAFWDPAGLEWSTLEISLALAGIVGAGFGTALAGPAFGIFLGTVAGDAAGALLGSSLAMSAVVTACQARHSQRCFVWYNALLPRTDPTRDPTKSRTGGGFGVQVGLGAAVPPFALPPPPALPPPSPPPPPPPPLPPGFPDAIPGYAPAVSVCAPAGLVAAPTMPIPVAVLVLATLVAGLLAAARSPGRRRR